MVRSTLVVAIVAGLALPSCKDAAPPRAEAGSRAAAAAEAAPRPARRAAPAPPEVGAEPLEGEVDIIAWPGYLERGDNDKAYDWVTPFERDTGCKVNVRTAGTSDEMVALMTEGGYDLVTASGDASLRLVAAGTVQPVDLARTPSYVAVDARLKRGPWYNVDGKTYGVPYQWGPNVLMYSTAVFKEPPRSWAVVFEDMTFPDGRSSKGRVQAYQGPIYIADAALYLMHKRPELGITDPYDLTEPQYAAALAVLRAQSKLVHRYWHDATRQVDDFKTEGVAATSSWGYMLNELVAAKQPVAATIPVEGSTGWADTTMLHARARHPGCAYRWMEWSLNARLQSALAEWFGSLPVVPAACKVPAPRATRPCVRNGFDRFDRVHFWRTPTGTCKQGACVPYSRWITDYDAIMRGR